MKIENSVALVTGGASGLGAGTVKMLLSNGAKVMIADIDESTASEFIKTLEKYQPNVRYIHTDVTDESSIEKAISATTEAFKGLDIVVNCAGVVRSEPIATPRRVASTENFREVIKINVLSTLNVCKYAAREMIKKEKDPISKERGVFINVSSILGIEGQRSFTSYAASKGAILAMSLPMARDLGRYGIRVMAICPSLFETPMSKKTSDFHKELAAKETSVGRLGGPDDFAALAKGIIECSYLNGTHIRLDGGQALGHF